MATVGNVDVKFSAKGLAQVQAQTNKAAGAMGGMANKADQARAGLMAMAKAAAALSAAAAATAAALFKLSDMAGKFEYEIAGAGAKSKATAKDLDVLTKAAIQAGIETQFSPKAAAEGLSILSSKGLDAAQATTVLSGALGIAQAGQISVADASDALVGVMNVYGYAVEDAAMLTDKLIAVTSASSFQASEFAVALGKAASKSKVFGQDLDTTLVSMAALRNASIDASSAQTAYTRAVTNFAAGTPKTKKALKELGVSYYDQEGQVRDVNLVIADMSEALQSLTPQQANAAKEAVFGARAIAFYDAIADMNIKTTRKGREVTLKGADAIREMRRRVVESSGAQKEYADRLKNTFEGSKVFLAGSAETLGILAGMPFAEIFRPMVETVTNGLNSIIKIVVATPKPVQKAFAAFTVGGTVAVGAVGGILAAVASLGAAVLVLGPALKAGLAAIPTVLAGIKIAVGAVTAKLLPLIVIIGGIALIVGALYESNHRTLGAWTDLWRGAIDYISDIISSLTGYIADVWGSINKFIFDTTKGAWDATLKLLNTATNKFMKMIGKLVDVYGEFLFAIGKEEEAVALRGLRDDLLNFDADWAANFKLMNDEWISPTMRQLGYFGDALVSTGAAMGKDLGNGITDSFGFAMTGLKRMLGFSLDDVQTEVEKKVSSFGKAAGASVPKVPRPPRPTGAGAGGGPDEAFMEDYAKRMRRQNQEERLRRKAQREQDQRDQAAMMTNRQTAGIGAFQAGMSGNIGGIVTGVAAAVGSAFGPLGNAVAGFADSLIGATTEGKVFKDILGGLFMELVEGLGPVIRLFSMIITELRPFFQIIGMLLEVFGVLEIVMVPLTKALGLVGLVVANLAIVFRELWITLLSLIDAIPGIDYTDEIRELQAAQARAVADRNDIIDRLRGIDDFEGQRARRERELAQATREATQAMLNVPSGYKVQRARFGAEAPVMDDFVMRPGQPPVSFSPNDTIVGSKNGAAGGTTIVIERLELSANNPSAFLNRLLTMVNSDNLRGGMALGGAYQGRP